MKFLVTDPGGVYAEHANELSNKGKNEVRYFPGIYEFAPEYSNYAPGDNFEHLKKDGAFEDFIDEADCIANFAVHGNAMIGYLREKYPKKSIFGSGKGDILENDRLLLKRLAEKFKLPVSEYKVLKGVKELEEYSKNHSDIYVKLDIFRGDYETFHIKDYKAAMNNFCFVKLRQKFGPKSEDITFIAEKSIETDVEIGFDGFFNGEKFCDTCLRGYEVHKNLYIGRVSSYKETYAPLRETMDSFIPLLKKLDYRGAISTEEKIVSKEKHYLLDWCSRLLIPGGTIYLLAKNWGEFVHSVGLKEDVKLDIPYKYCGTFSLKSKDLVDDYQWLDIKKGHKDSVRIVQPCMVKDLYYAIKGGDEVCTLTVGGNSVDEVIYKLKEAKDFVDCDGLDKDPLNGIDTVKDIIKQGQKLGIDF